MIASLVLCEKATVAFRCRSGVDISGALRMLLD
jgi:hypothetical protein